MLIERKLQADGFWIDLLDPTPEETARVESEHGLRVPSRAALEEIVSSSRLSRDGDVLYMNMPLATIDADGMITPSPMGFVLSDKIVVTIHFAKLHTTAAVLKRLETEKGP